MKLKFKVQPYQTHAVDSLADCFAGQPKSSGVSYRIDPGAVSPAPTFPQQALLAGMEPAPAIGASDAGFRNADLVLSPAQLLENLQAVQRRQNLPLSAALIGDKKTGCPLNLDIEMETGTGKTYCYIKSMFELNKRHGWSKFIVVVPTQYIRNIRSSPIGGGSNYVALAFQQPSPTLEWRFDFTALTDLEGGWLLQPGTRWKPSKELQFDFYVNYIDSTSSNKTKKNFAQGLEYANEVSVRASYSF